MRLHPLRCSPQPSPRHFQFSEPELFRYRLDQFHRRVVSQSNFLRDILGPTSQRAFHALDAVQQIRVVESFIWFHV